MNNKIYLILGLFLYLISFFSSDYFINILVVLFYICYVLFLFRKDKDFSAIALFFIWSFFITAIICCIAEFGGYFAEVQEFSYLTGATARNLILAFFTLYFSRVSFVFFSKKLPVIKIKTGLSQLPNKLIEITYLVMITMLFFIWVKYGHPNDYGLDRFVYWNEIAPSWGRWIQGVSALFILYFGSMYAHTKRKYYLIVVIIGNIVYYLVGDKLTIFVLSFFCFIIPVLILSKKNLYEMIFNKKAVLWFISLFFLLSISTYLSYFYISDGDVELATSRFLSRIVLQAQMWWRIDLLAQNSNIQDIDTVITGFIGIGADSTETGMYFFMKQVAPAGLYNMMVENGITFTMLYPANLIYFFPFPFSILVAIIIGLYVGFLFSVIYNLVKSRSSILLIFAAIFHQNIIGIILMGQTFQFFSSRNLLALVILLFYLILSIGHYSRNYTK